MARHITTDQIYGNCQVLSPDGVLMFLCTPKKMRWYLDNHLARVVAGNKTPTIQLTFNPKGSGHAGEYFYLMPRQNKCVVCGNTKDLTRHHVIPQCYRKHFPISLKKGVSHDVVATCVKCHAKAEREYDILKVELAKSYSAPLNGIGLTFDHDLDRAQRALKTLMWYKDKLPPMRVEMLEERVELYLGISLSEAPSHVIHDLLNAPTSWKEPWFKTHGELVIRQLKGDYEWFICMWRSYFLDHMKPNFMPEGWAVDHGF